MNTVTVTLGTLIDRTILHLEGAMDRPLSRTLAEALLADATDVTFTVDDAEGISVSDVLEVGSELMLVTAKSADPVPIVTVSRGYYFTTVAAHAIGAAVAINPRHPRRRIAEAIRRAPARMEALGLPLIISDTFNRTDDMKYVEMPAETRDVLSVGYISLVDGRWYDVSAWRFVDNVPTAKVASGKMVRLSRRIGNDDDLEINYRVPYRWSSHPDDPDETDTIDLYEGTDDLPSLYASAFMLAAREIARTDIDRAEEWNQSEPSRGGVSASVLRLQWQEFYRALDEARRLVPSMPLHRPYQRSPRLI